MKINELTKVPFRRFRGICLFGVDLNLEIHLRPFNPCCSLPYFWHVKLLMIDNYDSFTYNLLQLVEQAGVEDVILVKNDRLMMLNTGDFDKVLISPGPGLAAEAGDLMPFLSKIMYQRSILGICLGYEALAELCGARLVQLEEPLHGFRNIGNVTLPHAIFTGLPNRFHIGHYHSWIADESTFTPEMQVIMRDKTGLNMAFSHRSLFLTGLLFHPESVMTDFGLEIIKNWLKISG